MLSQEPQIEKYKVFFLKLNPHNFQILGSQISTNCLLPFQIQMEDIKPKFHLSR